MADVHCWEVLVLDHLARKVPPHLLLSPDEHDDEDEDEDKDDDMNDVVLLRHPSEPELRVEADQDEDDRDRDDDEIEDD